jgi:hypothetical protein
MAISEKLVIIADTLLSSSYCFFMLSSRKVYSNGTSGLIFFQIVSSSPIVSFTWPASTATTINLLFVMEFAIK